jgi:hypothetical protein
MSLASSIGMQSGSSPAIIDSLFAATTVVVNVAHATPNLLLKLATTALLAFHSRHKLTLRFINSTIAQHTPQNVLICCYCFGTNLGTPIISLQSRKWGR